MSVGRWSANAKYRIYRIGEDIAPWVIPVVIGAKFETYPTFDMK